MKFIQNIYILIHICFLTGQSLKQRDLDSVQVVSGLWVYWKKTATKFLSFRACFSESEVYLHAIFHDKMQTCLNKGLQKKKWRSHPVSAA